MHRILLLSLALIPAVSAQFAPAPFLIGGEHQFDTDLDGAGSFSRSVGRMRVSAPLFRSDETIVALSLGYQFESFDFGGLATDPWSDLHRTRLGLVVKSELGNGWSWLALPWVSADGESGADWSEAITFGGLGAAWYEYNDRLSLGIGLGLSGNLEDDLSVFPVVVLDWRLTDCLTVSTIPPTGFRIGPGVTLRWDVREDLDVSLIYQYQSDQHRLDENSAASANGVGEFRQSRIAVAATHHPTEHLSITGHIGTAFGGELELQSPSGSKLSERDFDTSLVVGFEGSLRF